MQEALFAAVRASRRGFVRCEIGDLPVHVPALSWASLEHGVLSFSPAHPSGSRSLPPPQPEAGHAALPTHVIAWDGAVAGREGACSVHGQDELVDVPVVVRDGEGAPVSELLVSGLSRAVFTDVEGRALTKGIEGSMVRLHAAKITTVKQGSHRRQTRLAGDAWVRVSSDTDEVEVRVTPQGFGLAEIVGFSMDAGRDRLEQEIADIDRARERPGLSREAWEQLGVWRARAVQDLDEMDAAEDEVAGL